MRTSSTLLLLTLAACTSPPEPCEDGSSDADEDGYVDVDDCDDDNAAIYPGAFEICDGIDNNCDGVADEIYGDADGDGIRDCEDEEICDGLDNDGDSYVDEGFPDTDMDGIADCVDDDCTLAIEEQQEIAIDASCTSNPGEITDPWNMINEWTWTGLSTEPALRDLVSIPVTGQLDDDNGDSVIDENDTVDVVFVALEWLTFGHTLANSQMVILSGEDGSETLSFSDAYGFLWSAAPMVIDIDGDGTPNIVSIAAQDREASGWVVVAHEPDGTETWRADTPIPTEATASSAELIIELHAADLDGDGDPEVMVETQVIDGVTGAQELELSTTRAPLFQNTTAADLDGDGIMEIIYANAVFDSSTGTELWSGTSTTLSEMELNWPAIIQYDSDPEAEVLFINSVTYEIYDDDGTLLIENDLPGGVPAPPCIADFDGDSMVEMGVYSTVDGYLYGMELDGTELWSELMEDYTGGAASCSAYDLNNDGAYEVLYSDQISLKVLDGTTGALQTSSNDHCSLTGVEYPVIADIDGDGAAEIITINQAIDEDECTYRQGGIVVHGHDGDGWAPSGQSWGFYDFRGGNHGEDSSALNSPMPWQTETLLHARPVLNDPMADLGVEITDSCLTGCEDTNRLDLAVRISNDGLLDIADADLVVSALDGTTLTELQRINVGAVASGVALASVGVSVDLSDIGANGLEFRVESASAIEECDSINNVIAVEPVCD